MPERSIFRRLVQFRLRTLLIVVLLIGIALAVYIVPIQRRAEAIRFYKNLGAGFTYTFDRPTKTNPMVVEDKMPDLWGPDWFRAVVGDEFGQEGPISMSFGGTSSAVSSDDLRFLPRLITLEFLEVTWVPRTDLPGGGIRRTLVGCPKVDDRAMPYIAKLINLRGLVLGNTSVTDDGLQLLGGLRNLQILSLHKTKRVTDQSVEVLAEFTELERLDLRGTQLTRDGLNSLKRMLPETNITHNSFEK